VCRERGVRVHYPLLGTAAYMSMLLWHAGLSRERAAAHQHAGALSRAAHRGGARSRRPCSLPDQFGGVRALAVSVGPVGVARDGAARPEQHHRDRLMRLASDRVADETVENTPKDSNEVAHRRCDELDSVQGLAARGGADRDRGVPLAARARAGRARPQPQRAELRARDGRAWRCIERRSPTRRRSRSSVRGTAGVVLQFPFYGAIMAMMRDSGLGPRRSPRSSSRLPQEKRCRSSRFWHRW
jgi:hypothetical protein